MIAPTPIENLPQFNTEVKLKTPTNSWLKILLIGGILITGFVIVSSMMNNTQQAASTPNLGENGSDPEQ